MHSNGTSEFLPDLRQLVGYLEVATGSANFGLQYVRQGKVLEQRYDVSERFVKCKVVDRTFRRQIAVHPIQQGVCSLVGNDVVRQASESNSVRIEFSRLALLHRKISEQQRLFFRIVVGVLIAKGMRVDS